MDAKEIVYAAFAGEEPDGMDPAEALLFFRMKDIYRRYQSKAITREGGEELKKKAMAEYRANSNHLEQGRAAQYRMARLWAELERHSSAYRKEKSLDTADKLMEAVYGLI